MCVRLGRLFVYIFFKLGRKTCLNFTLSRLSTTFPAMSAKFLCTFPIIAREEVGRAVDSVEEINPIRVLASQRLLAVWWPLRELNTLHVCNWQWNSPRKPVHRCFSLRFCVGMQMWSNPKRASINLSQEKSPTRKFFFISLSFLKFRMWCQRNSLRFYYFMACFDSTANHHPWVHVNLRWNHIRNVVNEFIWGWGWL